jgi:hypothetical protein
LSDDLKIVLQALAAKESRTLSNYIEKVLEKHIVDLSQRESGLLSIAMKSFMHDRGLLDLGYVDHLLEKHLDPEDLKTLQQAKAMQAAKSKKK